MQVIKKLDKQRIFTYLFLIAIFLIKTPPFYYIPIPNKIFSSHSLAKVMIGLVFIFLSFTHHSEITSLLNKSKIPILLVLFFFIGQSLSIINTIDIILFLKTYHNLIISLFIFFIAMLFIKPKTIKTLNSFLLMTGLSVILIELIFLLFPSRLLDFFSKFIQQEVLDAYLTNFSRGRFSLDLNTELFLPIFLASLLFSYGKNNYKSVFFFIISFTIIFLSMISNFRTRLVCSLFSTLIMCALYFKNSAKSYQADFKKYILNLIAFVLIFLVVSNIGIKLSNTMFRFNIINRFLLEDGGGNYRAASFVKSYEIFISSPLTGIGLGNFIYFNLQPTAQKYSITAKTYEKNYHELVLYSPHNIFAQSLSETGVFGTIPLLILITYFIFKDIRLFRYSKEKYIYGYIIASWEIFLFTLFNPASTIFIIGWFWFLRGVIEGLIKKY